MEMMLPKLHRMIFRRRTGNSDAGRQQSKQRIVRPAVQSVAATAFCGIGSKQNQAGQEEPHRAGPNSHNHSCPQIEGLDGYVFRRESRDKTVTDRMAGHQRSRHTHVNDPDGRLIGPARRQLAEPPVCSPASFAAKTETRISRASDLERTP